MISLKYRIFLILLSEQNHIFFGNRLFSHTKMSFGIRLASNPYASPINGLFVNPKKPKTALSINNLSYFCACCQHLRSDKPVDNQLIYGATS